MLCLSALGRITQRNVPSNRTVGRREELQWEKARNQGALLRKGVQNASLESNAMEARIGFGEDGGQASPRMSRTWWDREDASDSHQNSDHLVLQAPDGFWQQCIWESRHLWDSFIRCHDSSFWGDGQCARRRGLQNTLHEHQTPLKRKWGAGHNPNGNAEDSVLTKGAFRSPVFSQQEQKLGTSSEQIATISGRRNKMLTWLAASPRELQGNMALWLPSLGAPSAGHFSPHIIHLRLYVTWVCRFNKLKHSKK